MASKSSDWRPGPTVCRCCLAEGCYKDISTEYFWMGKREVYAEMLLDALNLSIAYSQSGGPNSNSRLICELCITRLREASEFKRQVQECEKTFMQCLDPGAPNMTELEATLENIDNSEVKVERVKLEKPVSDDDDFDDRPDFGDDDDDDLDDQPLTKFASKEPKKESVDILDLLDNSKAGVKRKSMSKTKTTPAKKVKLKEKPKKETVKPTTSKSKAPKPTIKLEKKKKENDSNVNARRNAEIIVKYSTAYPFRLPEDTMVCVYCAEGYDTSTAYRNHMNTEHQTFKLKVAFAHCAEGYIKADCTELRCRLCSESMEKLEDMAEHLHSVHHQPIDLNTDLGIQPFKLEKDKFLCAICNAKSVCIRQLSRHTQSHFLKFTCEACGKSYATITTLRHHIRFSHIDNKRICRKCKSTFSSLEAKRKHLKESPQCWSHLCNVCGARFVTWNLKQAHMNQVHGTQKRTYVCPECSIVFIDRKKYRTHFKITHTDDNFMCSCCGLKFETKRDLDDHRVVHTKERLFPCTVCSKSFPRKKNLAQHMWIHSEHKRFECTLCNKQFNQRVSWKTHMKSYHPEIYIPPYQSTSTYEGKNNNLILLSVLKTD